jgi:hypothetical protein
MARATLLSPTRYLRQGFGQALPDGFTISQLRSTLSRAQTRVEQYCNIPKQPSKFDWRGGTMTNEQQQWRIINPLAYGPGARRIYTNAGPIKAVIDLHLDLGKTYMVAIDPTDGVYINRIEQYVEIVAVNPTIVGFYPLAVNLGLYNPIARISYTYGRSFGVAGDVLEAETPSLFSATYGNWDNVIPPIVYIDDAEQDPGDYVVNYDDGTVAFDTEPDVGTEVTADYTYLAPDAVVQAIGITATHLIGESRLASRGMIGLQSIRVAEVALTQMQPSQMVTRNGSSIPAEAADLLGGFVFGSTG